MPIQHHHLLLKWLLFTGLVLFGLVVAIEQGYLSALVNADRSRISLVIGAMYLAGTLHCARRIYFVSTELLQTRSARRLLDEHGIVQATEGRIIVEQEQHLPSGLLSEYLSDVIVKQSRRAGNNPGNGAGSVSSTNEGNLPDVYASRVKGPSELGWFLADTMVKLGLLGTIIGFILMLGSVAGTSTLDPGSMQNVLREMSTGMGTALYTTLAGLLGSLLMSAQFQMLDRGAQELLDEVVYCAEVLATYPAEK
jgi:hypothetical protein